MATTLGPRLVFEMYACNTGVFEFPYRANYIDCIAVAIVCINYDGNLDCIGNVTGVTSHLFERD